MILAIVLFYISVGIGVWVWCNDHGKSEIVHHIFDILTAISWPLWLPGLCMYQFIERCAR